MSFSRCEDRRRWQIARLSDDTALLVSGVSSECSGHSPVRIVQEGVCRVYRVGTGSREAAALSLQHCPVYQIAICYFRRSKASDRNVKCCWRLPGQASIDWARLNFRRRQSTSLELRDLAENSQSTRLGESAFRTRPTHCCNSRLLQCRVP